MKKIRESRFILIAILSTIIIAVILVIAIPGIANKVNKDAKSSFENSAKLLIEAINDKKLVDDSFDPTVINDDNIMSILNIPNSNYSTISVVEREDTSYISVVGTGEWAGLVACGTYDNLTIAESQTGECDIDFIPPSITILGNNPVDILVGETYTDKGATASDNNDGNLTSKILVSNDINNMVMGTYSVTYKVVDNAGNSFISTRTVNVIDNIKPSILFKNNGNVNYTKTESTVVTVSDINSGVNPSSLKYLWNTLPSTPTEASFIVSFTNDNVINTPTDVTGKYYLWVLAKDNAGNTTVARTNVFKIDNDKPVITLIGDSNVTVNAGTSYIDAGATANDITNGDITSAIVKRGSVNTNVIGTYILTYNVRDSSGNAATQLNRTITVVDVTMPTITFGTNGDTTYSKGRSTTVITSDIYSGVNPSSLKYLWTTNTTTPLESSFTTTFINGNVINTPSDVTGSYYLWVLAKDNSGNTTITRTNAFNLDNDKPVIALIGISSIDIDRGSVYSEIGATVTDNIDSDLSVVTTGTINPTVIGTYTVTYNVTDNSGNTAIPVMRTVNVTDINYVVTEGVNKPKLSTGMTPIKWDGSTWIDTTEADTSWYNYTTTDKQWANARTADGSMWVWIPRYVYKISSGWHSNIAGTIDIQFTKGLDDNWNNSVIGNINADTTANASNNTWTNHPAFIFGNTELSGIWVAKFEASGTINSVDFKPNVASLRNLTIGSMFTTSQNIETNSRYGWGTSGINIDTHMMKNVEWGAATYLAKSTYGKNNEIWKNPSSDYITGCAGTTSIAVSAAGCTNTYNTANGQQASTTGNIYGIYDMAGGSGEYVSAYIGNGNNVLNSTGNSILTADSKYKNEYVVGASDDQTTNYGLAINKKGDAVYETSSSQSGTTSWYGDYSFMTQTINPWFCRGGWHQDVTSGGIFAFFRYSGNALDYVSFRVTVIVGEEL